MSTKIVQPFLLLILSCQKYKHKATLQKRTWLRTCLPSNFKYYHIIGKPDLETEYLFDESEKLLYVKTQDDYNSIPKKMMTAFQAIQDTFDFKYIFKTDDNHNLLKLDLFKILTSLLTEKVHAHYGGKIVDIKGVQKSMHHLIHPELPDNLYLQPTKYCSGPFYFLSSLAIQDLLKEEKSELFAQEYFEDYAVGFYLDDSLKQIIVPVDTDSYFREIR